MRRILSVLAISVVLASCGDGDSTPEGFEIVATEGNTFFVHVDAEFLDDKTGQRAAGKAICEQSGKEKYCEIYMWADREKVQTKLPITKDGSAIGMYTMKDGEVKLKVLSNNSEEE